MRRRQSESSVHPLRAMFAAVLALVTVTAAVAQQDPSAVELETTRLSETVYLLLPVPPMAGNLAVSAGGDGILMVDTEMMPITGRIKAAVDAIQEGGVDFVVNSHYHFDHAGGNAAFGLESVIVAHETVRARLAEGREAGSRFIEGTRPIAALPIITFENDVTFHYNGEDVDAIHLGKPAHTDGDVVIYFRGSNVIHTGDQYVNLGGFPYIDRDVGGSALGLRDNIARVLALIDDETKIVPGHGPLATKTDLQAFHDAVSDTIDFVAARKRSGKSLEVIQSEGLPEKYASYTGFIPHAVWIESVYASLDD